MVTGFQPVTISTIPLKAARLRADMSKRMTFTSPCKMIDERHGKCYYHASGHGAVMKR